MINKKRFFGGLILISIGLCYGIMELIWFIEAMQTNKHATVLGFGPPLVLAGIMSILLSFNKKEAIKNEL